MSKLCVVASELFQNVCMYVCASFQLYVQILISSLLLHIFIKINDKHL